MDPASLSAAAVKGGTMLTTGVVVADAVIFTDGSYMYLAVLGAIVSAFGVAHEVFGKDHKEYGVGETIVELLKGVALGLLAVPFWYIMMMSFGASALHEHTSLTAEPTMFTSLSLLVAFGMSWFTVPIVDFVAKTIPQKILSLLHKDK